MQYLELAIDAAKDAGKLLKHNFSLSNKVHSKGQHDLVSQTDIDSEKLIIAKIKGHYPDHIFQAEESGTSGQNSDFKWYIDPLDGTSNYLLGIPYFSVSIALARQGQVILGVVYNPILDELFTSEVGQGAYLNGERIHVSEQSDIKSALIASAYSSDENDIKRGLKTIEQLALNARKVIINFSPALDLCNIARGKLDALVDNGTTPEDHAAGSLILTEAGGSITNYKKGTWNVDEIGVIAHNGKLDHLTELAL